MLKKKQEMIAKMKAKQQNFLNTASIKDKQQP